jgi:uncharacterized protein CbrC (UPF0167 family)
MLWGKYLELLGQCFQRTRGQPQFLQVCWMLILQSFHLFLGKVFAKDIRKGELAEMFAAES